MYKLKDPIAAEVTAQPGRAEEAARRLQQLGFRIHHVGITISVEAPEELWKKVFGMTFRRRRRRRVAALKASEATVKEPTRAAVTVPEALRDVIVDVAFVRPPELY